VTFCAAVTGTPPLDTVTETLVVPNADSGFTPTTGELMVTADAPTANPSEPVTAAGGVPACEVPVIVVAPEVSPTALRVVVATPDASVNAAEGATVARVVSVTTKVTTAFGTTAPAAFLNVALTVAGVPLVKEVTAVPAELVNAIVSEAAAVVVVEVLDVVDVVPATVPAVSLEPPPPQPPKTPNRAAR